MQEALHFLVALREYQAELAHGNEPAKTRSRRACCRRVVRKAECIRDLSLRKQKSVHNLVYPLRETCSYTRHVFCYLLVIERRTVNEANSFTKLITSKL